jgi:hypothetical protein
VSYGSNDDQPRAGAERSAPTREIVLPDAAHLYLEGTAAAIIMAALGCVSGLVTLALIDDQRLALLVAAAAFTLTGIILTVRLWRMTRPPVPRAEPPA